MKKISLQKNITFEVNELIAFDGRHDEFKKPVTSDNQLYTYHANCILKYQHTF